jgi:hypothetical protein
MAIAAFVWCRVCVVGGVLFRHEVERKEGEG